MSMVKLVNVRRRRTVDTPPTHQNPDTHPPHHSPGNSANIDALNVRRRRTVDTPPTHQNPPHQSPGNSANIDPLITATEDDLQIWRDSDPEN